jgi:endonuclease/exonuclease/phosphatase family metal-dependent hydrolase
MSAPRDFGPPFDRSRRQWLCSCGGLGMLIGTLCSCRGAQHVQPQPLLTPTQIGHHFRVATFNIRRGSAADGPNDWRHRRKAVLDLLADLSCDFVGLQEAEDWQLRELLAGLPEYRAIGRGNGLFARSGEYCAILYRRDRWSIGFGDSETRWLSYTPTLPASRGYGSRHARILTWGRFRERKSGRVLWCFNTHFDHRSARSRRVSARLTLRWIEEALQRDPPDTPYLLTGDLNTSEDSRPLAILLQDHARGSGSGSIALRDSLRAAQGSSPVFSTFSGFAADSRTSPLKTRLDYVLVSPFLEVMNSQVDDRLIHGLFPSDHYPVWADLTFRNTKQS